MNVVYGTVTQSSPLRVRFNGAGDGVYVARNADVAVYPLGSQVLVVRKSEGDPGVAVCVITP